MASAGEGVQIKRCLLSVAIKCVGFGFFKNRKELVYRCCVVYVLFLAQPLSDCVRTVGSKCVRLGRCQTLQANNNERIATQG